MFHLSNNTGYFGDETFQAVDWTGTDNQKRRRGNPQNTKTNPKRERDNREHNISNKWLFEFPVNHMSKFLNIFSYNCGILSLIINFILLKSHIDTKTVKFVLS